jgi:hypothetical protein
MSRRLAAALVASAALAVAAPALPGSAAPAGPDGLGGADGSSFTLPAAQPPAGKAWLVGVITDQAGHPLQDVGVEAWLDDPAATEPTASDLTYENVANDQQGYFRLEVPTGASYRIVVSADPEDPYREFDYNGGKPVKVGQRTVRDLGASEIARVDRQPSKTGAKVKPGTVKAGKAATITITVTCENVDPVLGKVTATLGGKKVTGVLKAKGHGKVTLPLPKLKKPGSYTVQASYLGDSYVKKSATKVTVKVKK